MCQHRTQCPSALAHDREAARVVFSHPEQGWSLLCNGVVIFEDTGELLPDGTVVPPQRPPADRLASASQWEGAPQRTASGARP
ncbi:DUF5999 family protein [Streptomyces gobiensis]|uniref:DUF5999 family protein n=1 Tax=Streptomyces gobiensis TaxID=2875706 RepID=UPI001E57C285|nr:DUF5999 family protein [Streptomyces gobiensis]UGY94113.1 DUF5999 family protein [Streptomyces gobiensis]